MCCFWHPFVVLRNIKGWLKGKEAVDQTVVNDQPGWCLFWNARCLT